MGAVNSLGNIVGMIVGLAIIAVIAAHPTLISNFFGGVASAVTAAKS